MAKDFMALTQSNNSQSQIEALKKIGKGNGVNGGRTVMNGTDLAVFQGDLENFKKTDLGHYNEDQLTAIFGAIDANGDGILDEEEVSAFAAFGDDEANVISNDKAIIDESDFEALYELAQGYVDAALNDESIDDTVNNGNNTGNNTGNTPETEDEGENKVTTGTTSEQRATLNDADTIAVCSNLHDAMKNLGTDQSVLQEVIMSGKYSDADLVKIMKQYEEQYGETLMHDIYGEWGMELTGDSNQYKDRLLDASVSELQTTLGWESTDDIPNDISEMVVKMQNNSPLENIMTYNNLSPDEKAQLLAASEMMYPGSSAVAPFKNRRIDELNNDIMQAADDENLIGKKSNTASTTGASATDINLACSDLRASMHNYTDPSALNEILTSGKFSSGEIVKIMDQYEKIYGESLTKNISKRGIFKPLMMDNEKYLNAIYDAVSTEAKNEMGWASTDDIPKSVAAKAAKFHSYDNPLYLMGEYGRMSNAERTEVLLAMDMMYGDSKKYAFEGPIEELHKFVR